MKAMFVARAALAAGLVSAPAMAAPAAQPPMNAFRQAFYTCDNDGVVMIAYDAVRPKAAVMTTSGNKEHALKRVASPTGVRFSSETAKFWTDGAQVTIEGVETPLMNCKLKN